MAYNVKDVAGEFERMAPGSKPAVCSHFVDLKTQASPWGNNKRIAFCWEFTEKMNDGRPYVLIKEYFPSLAEGSPLRIDLESLRGNPFTNEEVGLDVSGKEDLNLLGFDLEKVVGVSGLLSVIDKKKKTKEGYYSAINSMSKLMAGMQKVIPSNQPVPEFLAKKAQEGLILANAIESPNSQPSNQAANQAQPVAPAPQQPVQQSAISESEDLPF